MCVDVDRSGNEDRGGCFVSEECGEMLWKIDLFFASFHHTLTICGFVGGEWRELIMMDLGCTIVGINSIHESLF
jgi:hypothetical protein